METKTGSCTSRSSIGTSPLPLNSSDHSRHSLSFFFILHSLFISSSFFIHISFLHSSFFLLFFIHIFFSFSCSLSPLSSCNKIRISINNDVQTTLSQILTDRKEYELIDEQKKQKSKYKNSGIISFLECKVVHVPTYNDYYSRLTEMN